MKYKNIFEKSNNDLIGTYHNSNGVIQTNASFGETDFIPVSYGEWFRCNSGSLFATQWDSSKNCIGYFYQSHQWDGWHQVTNSNASYLKFLFTVTAYNNDTFEIYTSRSGYQLIDPNYIDLASTDIDSKYRGMSGVAFGTSLTYRAQTTGGFLTRVASLSGITFDNQGEGSCGFIHNGSQGSNIYNRVLAYQNFASKDVVLIEGSVNDFGQSEPLGNYLDINTDTTCCGRLRKCIDHIQTQNPSIMIFVILDHAGNGISNPDQRYNGLNHYEFHEKLYETCVNIGVPCYRGYFEANMNDNTNYLFADNIHLSAKGVEHFGNCVWDFMKRYTPKVKNT